MREGRREGTRGGGELLPEVRTGLLLERRDRAECGLELLLWDRKGRERRLRGRLRGRGSREAGGGAREERLFARAQIAHERVEVGLREQREAALKQQRERVRDAPRRLVAGHRVRRVRLEARSRRPHVRLQVLTEQRDRLLQRYIPVLCARKKQSN